MPGTCPDVPPAPPIPPGSMLPGCIEPGTSEPPSDGSELHAAQRRRSSPTPPAIFFIVASRSFVASSRGAPDQNVKVDGFESQLHSLSRQPQKRLAASSDWQRSLAVQPVSSPSCRSSASAQGGRAAVGGTSSG